MDQLVERARPGLLEAARSYNRDLDDRFIDYATGTITARLGRPPARAPRSS